MGADANPVPLSLGLTAEHVRSQIFGTQAAQDDSSPTDRIRHVGGRLKNRAAAAFISRLVPRLEKVVPWSLAECPVCRWRGLSFRPFYGPGWVQPTATCPSCNCYQRHRLFALAYGDVSPTNSNGSHLRPIVWMAPEECLRPMFNRSTAGVITADLEMPGADLHCDAEMMPFASQSVGLLVSIDVLEHVENDSAAMAEVKRVLAPGATAIFHVPIMATETVEYGFANEGEFGHRRAYGPDVVKRFEGAGFKVRLVRAVDMRQAERRRYGLLKWDTVLVAL